MKQMNIFYKFMSSYLINDLPKVQNIAELWLQTKDYRQPQNTFASSWIAWRYGWQSTVLCVPNLLDYFSSLDLFLVARQFRSKIKKMLILVSSKL